MFIAKYDSGDVKITFEADEEVSDYGVPRSPVLVDPNLDTIRVTSLEILGVDVSFEELPVALQDEILANAFDWERVA